MADAYRQVRVELDSSMMRTLKDSEYSLCFAKKVGDEDFNTVWQCYSPTDYLSNNAFSWEPCYQMFCTNDISKPNLLNATTNTQSIAPGQTCLLDKYGILQPAADGGSADSLTVKNEYGTIRVGINQRSTGIRGVTGYTPIFTTPHSIINGVTPLKPQEKLLVWFEQNIHTGDSVKNAQSNAYAVDLTVKTTSTLFFNGRGGWEFRG